MTPRNPRRPLSLDLESFDDDAVAAGAEASLIAGLPNIDGTHPHSGPHPAAPAATVTRGVSGGLAIGGIGAAILALDKALRDHGETLESLTAAGPLAGALLQNWPLLLFGFLAVRIAAVRWTAHVERQKARDMLTARDRRATIKVLGRVAVETDRVAVEIGALRSDLAAVRELAAATDSRTRDETARLRQHVDEALGELRSRVGRFETARS